VKTKMSQSPNPYKKPRAVTTANEDNILMRDNSQSSKSSSDASKENEDNKGHKEDEEE